MNDYFDSVFRGHPLLVVLRELTIGRTLELAHLAWDVGIDCVEVTIQTPDAVAALTHAVRDASSRGRTVAAGTVTTTEAMLAAEHAGAAFTVSPGFDSELIEAHRRLGLPHLPGIATPSELLQAGTQGISWVKAFPAASLGVSWFSAMRGPFPEARFVATGGIAPARVSDYLNAGANVVGLGSGIAAPGALSSLSDVLASSMATKRTSHPQDRSL